MVRPNPSRTMAEPRRRGQGGRTGGRGFRRRRLVWLASQSDRQENLGAEQGSSHV